MLETMTEYLKKDKGRDFSGGLVVKNLSSNAGDMDSILGGRTKIPHAEGQLNPCAVTTEPSQACCCCC